MKKENNLNRPTWDDTFIELCYTLAKRSKDLSTRVGCVVVGPNREVRSMGYNGMPRGCDDSICSRHERPTKYLWMEHCERNAIYNAARSGVSLNDCKLYIPGPPCADCSRAIIQSGIVEIICDSDIAPERFKESCEASLEMLKESGIVVRRPNSEYPIKNWKFVNRDGWGNSRSRPPQLDVVKSATE